MVVGITPPGHWFTNISLEDFCLTRIPLVDLARHEGYRSADSVDPGPKLGNGEIFDESTLILFGNLKK